MSLSADNPLSKISAMMLVLEALFSRSFQANGSSGSSNHIFVHVNICTQSTSNQMRTNNLQSKSTHYCRTTIKTAILSRLSKTQLNRSEWLVTSSREFFRLIVVQKSNDCWYHKLIDISSSSPKLFRRLEIYLFPNWEYNRTVDYWPHYDFRRFTHGSVVLCPYFFFFSFFKAKKQESRVMHVAATRVSATFKCRKVICCVKMWLTESRLTHKHTDTCTQQTNKDTNKHAHVHETHARVCAHTDARTHMSCLFCIQDLCCL
jgi:hypothetical protein